MSHIPPTVAWRKSCLVLYQSFGLMLQLSGFKCQLQTGV